MLYAKKKQKQKTLQNMPVGTFLSSLIKSKYKLYRVVRKIKISKHFNHNRFLINFQNILSSDLENIAIGNLHGKF